MDRRRRVRSGIALGVALALSAPLTSAVGWSAHPVGEESHPGYVPVNKRCFGSPPRQTADPLAPPCVPFFDGDNGGSTWQGVSADEVLLVVYNDDGLDGDVATLNTAGDGMRARTARTLQTQLRFFMSRYQTYRRQVRLTAVTSSGPACGSQRSDAARVLDLEPFAVVSLVEDTECFLTEVSDAGVPVVTTAGDLDRTVFDDRPLVPGGDGLVMSFEPDLQEDAEILAAFVCDKLAGGLARFSPDPRLRSEVRRFEIVAVAEATADRERAYATALSEAITARCDARVPTRLHIEGPLGPIIVPLPIDPPVALPFIEEPPEPSGPVTTIICVCDVRSGELLAAQRAQDGGQAEWVLPLIARGDDATLLAGGSLEGLPVFGVTTRWVVPSIGDQYPTTAYREIDPDGTPELSVNHDIYHGLLLGFQGVQGAGPYLRPESWVNAFRTMSMRERDAEFPHGSFREDDDEDQPNTFRESALAWWWNPAGTSDESPTGCVASAARAGSTVAVGDASGWATGDQDLFTGDCLQPQWVTPTGSTIEF